MDSGKTWSQGIARKALSGSKTHNPTPSALSLLRRALGQRRASAAVRRAGKHRRSFHRGNPLPAIVASVVGGLGGRFKTPSEKRAGNVANTLVSAAVAGNLTAAKAIAERTEIGIAKERAVWRKAFAQIPKEIVALLARYGDRVPGVDHTNPETAADTALSRAFDVREVQAGEKAEGAARGAAAERRAAQGAAASERREARFTQLGAGALQALARGGRRPARRRRSTRGRRLSL